MKDGSLTRFRPDPQDGGLKSGRGVRNRIRKTKEGATRSVKQAVKRKAYEVLDRNIKRKFNDIFGD